MAASFTETGRQQTTAGVGGSRTTFWVTRIGGFAVIVVFTIAVLLPIFYMATTSIKEPIEIRESGALLPTKGIFLINWIRAYSNEPLHMFLLNSTIVAVVSTLLALLIAVPTTYAIVRFRVGGDILPSMILGGYVMPPIVVSIPFFMGIKLLGLPNTKTGLILVHAMINTPVAIWLLDSFFRAVPQELEEAAWIDGYSRFDTLRRVVLPLVMPGLVATAIICLILSWNEFLFALILTYSEQSQTFPVGISRYQGEHGLQFGEMSAAALTGIIPIYILVLLFQRYLVTGLTRGGVKG
ncbi:MAG TPA: carbohydrate ABC transporter permease [Anaerolineae bacterium]|nr:carbohydrate ABC transporter permease [Anaerolineae bacterium]